MAMGRSRSALPDLDEAIKLNPKFLQVYYFNLHNNVVSVKRLAKFMQSTLIIFD